MGTKVNVERTTTRLLRFDDLDRKGLISFGIELARGIIDDTHDLGVTAEVRERVLESLNGRDVHQELLHVQ